MNTKRRTVTTITLMTIFAVVILLTYFYWTNRTEPLSTLEDNRSEVAKLASKDLEHYYPGTTREVVKLFAKMMQELYNNPKDEDSKALALKIRELYDEEFLRNNPEDTYLINITSDLALWDKEGRRITNFLLVNEDQVKENELNGIKYATRFVAFTIQENSKFTETWNVLLRQNLEGQWKILGWEPVDLSDEVKE